MFARVQVVERIPAIEGAGPGELLDLVSQHSGFCEGWMLRQLNGRGGVFVSLWQTRRDAELAAERTAAVRGERPFPLAHDEVYEVRDILDGAGSGRGPGFAQVLWLHGPRGVAQAAADERAGRERVWPAIRDLPGVVRAIAMTDPQHGLVVLTLTTDAETIDTAQRVTMSTELLPGEDPALLAGPDQIDICAVLAGAGAVVGAG